MHTPGIWDLCCLGGREFVNQSSRGWGIWSPCISVGNLNHSLDYMLIICRLYYCLWDELDMLWNNFRGIERLWLCGQLATNKYDFIQCYCCIFKFCICQFIHKNVSFVSFTIIIICITFDNVTLHWVHTDNWIQNSRNFPDLFSKTTISFSRLEVIK